MEKLKLIIAAATQGSREEAARALSSPALQTVALLTPDSAGLNKAGYLPADVLALYSDCLDRKEADFIERLYMTRPNLVSVLLTQETDADMLQRALLAGISRVVNMADGEEAPVDGVLAAYNREKNRRLSAGAASVAYESKVMAFFGTKGGVGKTTIAVNVAVALARMNKRVALIDMDLQFGDVGIFLDISKADSIVDIVEENDFDYTALVSFLYKHSSGLRVLCAPPAPEYAEMIKAEHVEKLIVGLRSEFDYIILDMPPAFNDLSLTALEQCSEVFFVVNPDISCLRNAQVSFAVFAQLNMADKLRLIINKEGYSDLRRQDMEAVLGQKALLALACDLKNAARSVNRGLPLVLGYRRSKIAAELNAFADRIVAAGHGEGK